MRKIPMAKPFIGESEAKAVYDTVKSGWLSMGPIVEKFEKNFAKRVGSKYAISTNNGTTALHVALIASGIKDGDEVLVPDITFASTANVVMYERAIPILVECDPNTYNISLEDIESKITKKTKAIMPVDMNGMPVDYDSILQVAKKHNLKVIADSAESLGAVYKGKSVGSIAPIHTFSFFPNKNMTTGEGGMITTNDTELALKMAQLRNMGQDYRYHHVHLGFNYRMTEVAATIGIEQMKKFNKIVKDRERIVNIYNDGLQNQDGISLPFIPEYVDKHAWYMYTVSLDQDIDRDAVVSELDKAGIETRTSFPPIHTQPYYAERFKSLEKSYEISYEAWKRLLNLPIWVGLPEDDQKYVIDKLISIVQRRL
jgi:dTDP-4-amino-4,6-dideoxygalactose transaminase